MSGNNQQTASRPDVTTMRYDANKKSTLVAYLLWFFLGWLGGHRFYLGHTGSAVAMLIITIISTILIFVGIGFLGLMAIGIWALVDAFLIPGMVRSQNNELINTLTR
ncbi:MAG: TM2 domain-containing protein [Alphaproteobacteria bacterium]|nr:TM2 domain-containing protein [Alphaproteobacteria bacterium]